MLSENITNLKSVTIGIEKESLNTYKYNFKTDRATMVSANELSFCNNFLINLMRSFNKIGNVVSVLLDFKNELEALKPFANSYCNKNFDDFSSDIIKYFDEKIKDSEYDLVFFIVGVEKFRDCLETENHNKYIEIIKKYDNCIALFIDDVNTLKKLSFESWFTGLIQNQNGIWIGNGAGTQSVIKTSEFNKKYNIKISNEFSWVFRNGDGTLVKMINESEINKEVSNN